MRGSALTANEAAKVAIRKAQKYIDAGLSVPDACTAVGVDFGTDRDKLEILYYDHLAEQGS